MLEACAIEKLVAQHCGKGYFLAALKIQRWWMRTIPSLQIERFFLCTLVIDAVARRISRHADALAMKRGEKQKR